MQLLRAAALGWLAIPIAAMKVQTAMQMDADAWTTQSPNELADSLTDLLSSSSSNTPALASFVRQIRSLVTNQMKPQVLSHQREEQRRLDAAAARFSTCTTSSSELTAMLARWRKLQQDTAAARDAFSASQKAEQSCLAILAPIAGLKTVTCQAVDTLVQNAGGPSTCSLPTEKNSFKREVSSRSSFYRDLLQKAEAAFKACAVNTEKADKQTAACKITTRTREEREKALRALEDFLRQTSCSVFSLSSGICKANDSCYTAATDALASTIKAARIQEDGMKTEWESIARVRCLADVFDLDDENKQAGIKACTRRDIDVSHLNLRYPAAPTKKPCSVVDGAQCPTTTTTTTTTARTTTTAFPRPATAPPAATTPAPAAPTTAPPTTARTTAAAPTAPTAARTTAPTAAPTAPPTAPTAAPTAPTAAATTAAPTTAAPTTARTTAAPVAPTTAATTAAPVAPTTAAPTTARTTAATTAAPTTTATTAAPTTTTTTTTTTTQATTTTTTRATTTTAAAATAAPRGGGRPTERVSTQDEK